MLGTAEKVMGGGQLDDFPIFHDRDAIADLMDHREVVRDEDQREVVALP